jgi:hypothetical protein
VCPCYIDRQQPNTQSSFFFASYIPGGGPMPGGGPPRPMPGGGPPMPGGGPMPGGPPIPGGPPMPGGGPPKPGGPPMPGGGPPMPGGGPIPGGPPCITGAPCITAPRPGCAANRRHTGSQLAGTRAQRTGTLARARRGELGRRRGLARAGQRRSCARRVMVAAAHHHLPRARPAHTSDRPCQARRRRTHRGCRHAAPRRGAASDAARRSCGNRSTFS